MRKKYIGGSFTPIDGGSLREDSLLSESQRSCDFAALKSSLAPYMLIV